MSTLPAKIDAFLAAYARKAPDYDPKWDEEAAQFTGPDSSMLWTAARQLEQGVPVSKVHSSMSSGCYKGWTDADVIAEHDALVREINSFAD